jgi:hypothetical protein
MTRYHAILHAPDYSRLAAICGTRFGLSAKQEVMAFGYAECNQIGPSVAGFHTVSDREPMHFGHRANGSTSSTPTAVVTLSPNFAGWSDLQISE